MECVVASCNSKYIYGAKPPPISFFQLPSCPTQREVWFKAIGDLRLSPTTKIPRICSKHFKQKSYYVVAYPKYRNGKISRRLKLRPNAIPTLRLKPQKKRRSRFQYQHEPNDNVEDGNLKDEIFSANHGKSLSSSAFPSSQDDSNVTEERNSPLDSTVDIDYEPTPKCGSLIKNSPAATFPRRSERLFENRVQPHPQTEVQSQSNVREQQKYSCEEDGSPAPKIQQRNSDIDVGRDREQPEEKCAILTFELEKKEEEQQKIISEIEELKRLNGELYAKLASQRTNNFGSKEDHQNLVHAILPSYFTEGQIQCIVQGRQRAEWSVDDYTSAIYLYSLSREAYRYMHKKFHYPLPLLSGLRNWTLTGFDISEGFLKDVLTLMREKTIDLSPLERIGVITFGEMNLSREITFNAKLEQVIGPCSKVHVIMVHALFSNWKQPIYYKFDQPLNKSILNEALYLLDNAGYQVVATTFNTEDRTLWKELGITEQNHFFPHPTIKDAVVYAFADVPHLLKKLRNSFYDNGFVLSGSGKKYTSTILQNIIDLDRDGANLGIANRLTQLVMDARNTRAEAVWPAAKIWSRSVAKAIKWAGDQKLLNITEYQRFSDFVKAVNDWFDVHNSKQKFGEHQGVNAYGVDVETQSRILLLMNLLMQTTRVGERKTLMPFQESILISNASLRELHCFLESKFPNDYKYLITRRLQRDVLENFFSHIQRMGASGDQLSGYDFRNRFHSYLLGKHPTPASNDNDRSIEEESTSSGVFSEIANSSVNSNLDRKPTRINQSGYIAAMPSSSENTNRYCFNLPVLNSTLRPPKNLNCSVLLADVTAVSFNGEPVCDYEPDPGDQIIISAELLQHITNLSPCSAAEDVEDTQNADPNVNDMESNYQVNKTAYIQDDALSCYKEDTFEYD